MSQRTVTQGVFVIERRIKASPERVFNAFADPEAKAQWFGGPKDWERQPGEFDFRVGGVETNIGGPKGGWTSRFHCRYHNIEAASRIVYTYDMFIDDVQMSTSLAVIEFRPDGDGTHFVLTESGAYYDGFSGPEHLAGREHGSNALIDALVRALGE